MEDTYKTIQQKAEGLYKEKGSKFIAYAYPIKSEDEAKEIVQGLKKEFYDARHHCFAYMLGRERLIWRINDDGEPSGTAGKPILGQIDSRKLTNTSIIVVRYFGGTLLGVPGLINAYKTVSALALQTIPVIQKQIELTYSVHFDYTQVNDVMQVLKQGNCSIIQQDLQLFSEIKAGIPKNRLDEVIHRLNDLRNVELKELT